MGFCVFKTNTFFLYQGAIRTTAVSKGKPTEKLSKVLEMVARNLTQSKIPFAVIGAMALGSYGLPRIAENPDERFEL